MKCSLIAAALLIAVADHATQVTKISALVVSLVASTRDRRRDWNAVIGKFCANRREECENKGLGLTRMRRWARSRLPPGICMRAGDRLVGAARARVEITDFVREISRRN